MNLSVVASDMKRAFKGTKAVVIKSDDLATEVYHYSACICKVKANGEVVIDNGDYYTKTTKRHLNTCFEVLGIRTYLFQKNFDWFFADGKRFHRHYFLSK